MNIKLICSFRHTTRSSIENIFHWFPSNTTSVHVNIETTTRTTNLITIVNVVAIRFNHMEIQIVKIVPCESATQIANNTTAGLFNTFLNGICHVTIICPAKGIIPLKHILGTTIRWCNETNQIVYIIILHHNFDRGNSGNNIIQKILNCNFICRSGLLLTIALYNSLTREFIENVITHIRTN